MKISATKGGLVLLGFVAGIALVASCGGGGEEAAAQGGGGSGATFTTTPIDAPVGFEFVLGGDTYTVVQLEVPRFDSSEVFLIKIPQNGSATSGSTGRTVNVSGRYPDGAVRDSQPDAETTISGFETELFESFGYSAFLSNNNTGSTVSHSFFQNATAVLRLGPQTDVTFSLSLPTSTLSDAAAARSADGSDRVSVFPPTPSPGQRANRRQSLRELLRYVSVRKKP